MACLYSQHSTSGQARGHTVCYRPCPTLADIPLRTKRQASEIPLSTTHVSPLSPTRAVVYSVEAARQLRYLSRPPRRTEMNSLPTVPLLTSAPLVNSFNLWLNRGASVSCGLAFPYPTIGVTGVFTGEARTKVHSYESEVGLYVMEALNPAA